MQRSITHLKRAIVIGALFLSCLGVFTSFQVAQAHPEVPEGCKRTHLFDGCKRCGPVWWYKYTRYELKWECPDGSRGSYTYSGACRSC